MSLGLESEDRKTWTAMYIDDLTVGEVLDLEIAVSTFSQRKEERRIHARKSEDFFKIISQNATSIGMQINSGKTQLLCVCDNLNSSTKSFIYTSSETCIESAQTMKILGFTFGERPTVTAHIDYTIKNLIRPCGLLYI